ncbi:MAG TPA: tRNA (adenosine(37)-N6)-dimethylallyltransferase MiaA [Bacteroidetes bacterium]|nr:tRNA (adenosine(37)-N6)-dimethylallyltransferase MiaA [Bacteroidota bacterium]
MQNTLIVITGPTASGKTRVAAGLAREWQTAVISADSRQMYREMSIGTAKPRPGEKGGVTHYFIDHLSIHDYYNASMFDHEALELMQKLFRGKSVLVMAGGSGLYVNAVCYGIDDLPRVDEGTRNHLVKIWKREGMEKLREMLLERDPDYYRTVDLNNPKRVLKGLEISIMTGKPYSAFLTRKPKVRDFRMILIGLTLPRKELYEKINRRVDQMVAGGLVEEARALYPFRHLNALNTVGYRELFDHFSGKTGLEEAVEKIKDHTRQYARKQLTWFRKNPDITWFHPGNREEIVKYLKKHL